MINEVLETLPGPAKASADVLAAAGSISVLVGVFSQIIGLIAAILSMVWAGLRLYEVLTRKRYCINATADCPSLCPPGCQQWCVKPKQGETVWQRVEVPTGPSTELK